MTIKGFHTDPLRKGSSCREQQQNMNMMTACCQRTKKRWGQVFALSGILCRQAQSLLCAQTWMQRTRQVQSNYEIHLRICVRHFLNLHSRRGGFVVRFSLVDTPVSLEGVSRIWRRYVDAALRRTRPRESCQMGCHPVFGNWMSRIVDPISIFQRCFLHRHKFNQCLVSLGDSSPQPG